VRSIILFRYYMVSKDRRRTWSRQGVGCFKPYSEDPNLPLPSRNPSPARRPLRRIRIQQRERSFRGTSMVSSHLPGRPPERSRIPRLCPRARRRARQTSPHCSYAYPSCSYYDATCSEPKATATLDADDRSTPTCWGVRDLDSILES